MSKTIECVSKHIGEINFTTRKDEQRTVMFEEKNGMGFAMLDEDEAEILLGGIGRPEYWKPGTTDASDIEAVIASDPAAAEAAEVIKRGRKKAE